MLGRDFAGTSANIARMNTPDFTTTRPNMRDSILEALNAYYSIDEKERNRREKERLAGLEQNLSDAIKSGDEEAINNAYAEIDPSGYIQGVNDARNKRELEELKIRNSMDLETLKNQLAYNLARDKAGWASDNDLKKAQYEYDKALALEDVKSRNAYNLARDKSLWDRESDQESAFLDNYLQQKLEEQKYKNQYGLEEQKYKNQYGLEEAKAGWSSDATRQRLESQLQNSLELEAMKNENTRNLERDKIGWQLAAEQLGDEGKRTNNIVNYEYLVRNGMPEEEARAFAFPVNTEAIGNAIATGSLGGLGEAGQSAYDRERGKQLAQSEEKTKTKIIKINNQIGNLTNLINNIQENPETVGFQSGPATVAARVAGLFGSKTAGDYLKKRGGVIRQLGTIQNDLINQARDSGQSGINTINEINQIIKGLNENSSMQEVIGALGAIRDSAQRLSWDLQNGTTNNPTNSFTSIPTDEDAWGGI